MMKNIVIYFSTLFLLTFSACAQTKSDRVILGKSYAQQELKSSLTNKKQHNVIDYKSMIIKDSVTAINMAEPVLFSVYGKSNIIEQKPYEAYLIDGYWLINGTLPKGYMGGTFLIIINAFDGKIIKITHGK